MRYRFIWAEEGNYPVYLMCRLMKVSRSGYYAYRSRKPSGRDRQSAKIGQEVSLIFARSRKTYGSRRIRAELMAQDVPLSRKRVVRLMRINGLQHRPPKRWVRTTDSKHTLGVAPNLLQQKFHTDAPGKVWVTDITYLETKQGFLYLAVVLDMYSRKVIGHAMSHRIDAALCMNALHMAKQRGHTSASLIHHSDRGSQYASHDYVKQMNLYQITQSMSRKGNCLDNAVAESFFATLKRELVSQTSYQSHAQLRLAVFEYIEVFYNRVRRHSSLNYHSPLDFEKIFFQNHPQAA